MKTAVTLLPCARRVTRKRVVCGGAPELDNTGYPSTAEGHYYRCSKCGGTAPGALAGYPWTERNAALEWNRFQTL